MAAFSELAFGRNIAFSDQSFLFGVPTPALVSIIIPTIESRGGVGRKRNEIYGEENRFRIELERRFKQQNSDDLEVVHILTEFLSRM